MIKNLITLILSTVIGSVFALTGFGESNIFSITEETLPVELSSFTATATAQNYVRLQWTTQSESNLLGYYIFRDSGSEIASAVMVSGIIQPTNTSSQHSYNYTDTEIYNSGFYWYWLYSLEMDGSGTYHGPVSVLINLGGSDPGTPDIPLTTGLKSIYPNPFNPNTIISYQVKTPASVKIEVYNTRGQLVNSFARAHELAGQYTWLFEGVDRGGRQLASGVYRVVMTAGKDRSIQKMVLMK